MQKILYIIPKFSVGGAEVLALMYARNFDKSKFNLAVSSMFDADNTLLPQFGTAEVETVVGGEHSIAGYFQTVNKLRQFVRSWQPNTIHTHMLSADLAGNILKFLFPKIKWVSTQHNVEHKTSWARRALWRFILHRAEAVIAVSETVREFCLSEFKIPPEKLRLVKNAIPLQPWLRVPADTLFQNSDMRLAVIGRLEHQKGHDILLKALAQISNVPWHLSIFGDGSLRQNLETLSKQLNINDRIEWCGVVSNLPECLRDIDVVILPSRFEGRSLALLEAMAGGRVVVATQAAATGVVENGVTGYVSADEDPADLARIITEIDGHRDVARKVAQRGREYAREQSDFGKFMSQLEAIYG